MLKYLNIIEYFRISRRVPFLLALVFWLLLIVGTVPFKLFGFNSFGWGWVIPVVFSLVYIVVNRSPIRFPVLLWLPWILVVLAGFLRPHIYSLQSTIQILTPIIIGIAASKASKPYSWDLFVDFIERTFVIWLVLIPLVKLPQLLLGIIPQVTGLATEGITSLLFQSIFLAAFINTKQRKYILFYALALLVPVIALTRGPIIASIALLILIVSPISISKRILISFAALVIGYLIFVSPRFQMKSFRKTDVSITEVIGNPDIIHTTGRKQLWKMVSSKQENKLWGDGSNAAVSKAISLGYKRNYLLHNDWLRIKYDYGVMGLIVFAATIIGQIIITAKRLKYESEIIRFLGLGAVSAFIPFMAVMYTDNILIYAHSFGSLQFALLGLVYSSNLIIPDEGRDSAY